jgi:hypothetical protein
MDLSGVKVGDILVLTHNTKPGGTEVPVIKVGRKLLTVQESPGPYGTGVYRIESGVRNDDYRYTRVETREAYAARQEKIALWERLRAAGISFDRVRNSELSNAKLRALLAVVEDDSL